MDNKKWYKRISTCFWFLLATMPVWFSVLRSLGFFLVHTDSLSLSDIQTLMSNTDLSSSFSSVITPFVTYLPSFIRPIFASLFNTLNVGSGGAWLVNFMSWFCWVYFIELMVDFVVWLPRLCHSFMERWCRD